MFKINTNAVNQSLNTRKAVMAKQQNIIVRAGALVLLLLSYSVTAQQNYNNEYELVGYAERPAHNPIARLEERIANGETVLEWKGHHGYLEDLLEELGIVPASQMLVFSKTSLQHQLISGKTPRSLYFADDIYIGWVQNSEIIEVTAMDDKLGAVFYVFHNSRNEPEERIEHVTQSCLVCHDSYGMMGGGVPQLMSLSSVYSVDGLNLNESMHEGNVTDATPVKDRWGGWYVTGRHGEQEHLGNIQLQGKFELASLEDARRGNIDTLHELGILDPDPYLTPTSDIVALLVLEHQLTVQNQITYVKFKAPAVLDRIGHGEAVSAMTWNELPENAQRALERMLDNMVNYLFFVDSAQLEDKVAGLPEYDNWFEAQGVRDEQGRSLRDLNLETTLLDYPLSYLVYSSQFNTLPPYALDYVYQQLANVLNGHNTDERFAHITRQDKQVIREILLATKPDIAAYL